MAHRATHIKMRGDFIMYLYVIYDSVGEQCSPPFVAKNVDVAKRQFRIATREASYPHDRDWET